MNFKVMLFWGAIIAVCQPTVVEIAWADIDLTKYEREVVRSDQIQVTIADGSEGEFWKRGSLSDSFQLTPGEDFFPGIHPWRQQPVDDVRQERRSGRPPERGGSGLREALAGRPRPDSAGFASGREANSSGPAPMPSVERRMSSCSRRC